MQKAGKILFYNSNEGTGIIITADKKKFEFAVVDWDDYEVMPESGMVVMFVPDGLKAMHIVTAKSAPSMQSEGSQSAEEAVQAFSPESPMLTSIRLQMSPQEAIKDYFDRIEDNIRERTQYQTATGRLDFLRIRRFLFTTYNNLTELDMNFITPKMKEMRHDLLEMAHVYDDYKTKATYPDVAFEKVFLSRQPDYVHLHEDAEYCMNEMKRLHTARQILSEQLEEKENIYNRTRRNAPHFESIEHEFKELKKNYVDTVHAIASLEERYKEVTRLMHEFTQEHEKTFMSHFLAASSKYRKEIIYILDAQAYKFDELLWQQAKKSKVIKRMFEEAHIEGEYCAKTYLKYYLKTLDPAIISTEQQELFELYEYLESLERDAIMILVHDIDDALRIKYLLAKIDSTISIEAFVDERKALMWAKEKQAAVIILEDQLQNLSYSKFIQAYKKRVSFRPIVLLLSNRDLESFSEQEIEMVIHKGYADKEMIDAVKEVLQKD